LYAFPGVSQPDQSEITWKTLLNRAI